MKKIGIFMMILFLLSGCISHGGAVSIHQAVSLQGQHVLDQMIYLQAQQAMNARMEEDYSVYIEPVSGTSMTLIMKKDEELNQMILHESGYTQWIQILDDRILSLTKSNDSAVVEMKNDLLSDQELLTMIECAENPVHLVQNRSFQRVAGAEEGSLQIATDNIDYWMKVSSDQKMDQVRLYFSDLPMMTLTYSNEIPAFPELLKEDYPTYKEILNISVDTMKEKGFDENGTRTSESKTEILSISEEEYLMNYTVEDTDSMIQLIYNELTLKGVYTEKETGTFCEVVLLGDEQKNDDLICGIDSITKLQKVLDELKDEFK